MSNMTHYGASVIKRCDYVKICLHVTIRKAEKQNGCSLLKNSLEYMLKKSLKRTWTTNCRWLNGNITFFVAMYDENLLFLPTDGKFWNQLHILAALSSILLLADRIYWYSTFNIHSKLFLHNTYTYRFVAFYIFFIHRNQSGEKS